MPDALLLFAIIGYTLGISLTTVVTVYRSEAARRGASVLFVLTWLLHLAAVVAYGSQAGHLPLRSRAEYLLVLGLVVLGLHLFVWFRLRVYVAGLVLPPIAALSAVAAQQLLNGAAPRPEEPGGAWFLFHTSVSTLGMAILCVAFAMSIIYLLQDRALKSHKTLRLLERLPALEKCDKIGFQALLLGFVLLTLGIGTGIVINEVVDHTLWKGGAKQIFPLLAWVVFASVLGARTILGFRGRKSALLTITGFALGLLTVLGMAV